MARFLLAWELGGDYGHLMRFLTLARELVRRGHEPVFALRELTHVETVLGSEPFRVFQAPIFAGQVTGLPAAIGFADACAFPFRWPLVPRRGPRSYTGK